MRAPSGNSRTMHALTLLTQDHNNVNTLFERFEVATDPAERRRIADLVIEHLSVHAAVEEQLFYPAVREAVPPAGDTVLEGLEEHHVVKWTLSELEKLAPTDERFVAKMTVLIDSVRQHVHEEEDELFPQIREAMTNEQLLELGEQIEMMKPAAPRRPHPRTPDTPPMNLVVGLPVAILDRAVSTGRDLVGKVLTRR